jgi:hypothetical protein
MLASYFVGRLLIILKQHGLLYFTITRGGSVSLPSLLHASSTVTHHLDFIPPLKKSSQKVMILLGRTL